MKQNKLNKLADEPKAYRIGGVEAITHYTNLQKNSSPKKSPESPNKTLKKTIIIFQENAIKMLE